MIYALTIVIAMIATFMKNVISTTNDYKDKKTLFYLETFDSIDTLNNDDDGYIVHGDNIWIKSNDNKYRNQPILVKALNKPILKYESNHGLQFTQEMKHYGISSILKQPILFNTSSSSSYNSNDNKHDLIVQYEIKLEESLECGGTYIKLLRSNHDETNVLEHVKQLNNETPYTIMFGPDKCGNNNKIHFIIQYQNPITKEWNELHYNETIPAKIDKFTHLYTLHMKADSTFDIYMDMKLMKSGHLLTHMLPSINPDEEIDDINDKKPSDWVDKEMIPDPTAIKPSDWDELQPKKIQDLSAKKPDLWDEHAKETIPDPTATKPIDWDDEEDGEWEVPTIPNPICVEVGCGPWTAPMIPNPLYRGIWKPASIKNPAYQGIWKPSKIKNPNYYYDNNPIQSLAPIIALSIEIWTTSAGLFFDNFILTSSISDAMNYAKETTYLKVNSEREVFKQEQFETKSKNWKEMISEGSFRNYIGAKAQELAYYIEAYPVRAITLASMIIVLFLYLVLYGGSSQMKEISKVVSSSTGDYEENKENMDINTTTTTTNSIPTINDIINNNNSIKLRNRKIKTNTTTNNNNITTNNTTTTNADEDSNIKELSRRTRSKMKK